MNRLTRRCCLIHLKNSATYRGLCTTGRWLTPAGKCWSNRRRTVGFPRRRTGCAASVRDILSAVRDRQIEDLVGTHAGLLLDRQGMYAHIAQRTLRSNHEEGAEMVQNIERGQSPDTRGPSRRRDPASIGISFRAWMSWSFPSLICMNAGTEPRRSSSVCSLMALLVRRSGPSGTGSGTHVDGAGIQCEDRRI